MRGNQQNEKKNEWKSAKWRGNHQKLRKISKMNEKLKMRGNQQNEEKIIKN